MRIDTLEDTVKLMLSDNYEDRLKAEFYQLFIRRNRLKDYISHLNKDKSKEYDLLNAQLKIMEAYLIILEARYDFEQPKYVLPY